MFESVSVDEVKKFWDRRPCNVRHSNLEVGTKEYFDAVETRRYFVEPHIRTFAQFDRWKGKRVLEIGCGIGTDSINFSRAGADLTVVDLSEKSLELCQRRFDVFGLKARFLQGNAEELNQFLEPQQFDCIYSMGVLHHTPNPPKAFQQLRRYMGPASELRIMLYARYSWKALSLFLARGWESGWNLDRVVAKYSEAQTGCPVTYIYSFRQVRELLKDFEITSIAKDFIFPYKVSSYVAYEYQPHWYFRMLPRPLFKALEKKLGWQLLIVATNKRVTT